LPYHSFLPSFGNAQFSKQNHHNPIPSVTPIEFPSWSRVLNVLERKVQRRGWALPKIIRGPMIRSQAWGQIR
jgi:hypothetical protein